MSSASGALRYGHEICRTAQKERQGCLEKWLGRDARDGGLGPACCTCSGEYFTSGDGRALGGTGRGLMIAASAKPYAERQRNLGVTWGI